jgi:hypothetical protein
MEREKKGLEVPKNYLFIGFIEFVEFVGFVELLMAVGVSLITSI